MLTAKQIIEKFDLTVENKDNADIEREINRAAIHRAGLEISGKSQ